MSRVWAAAKALPPWRRLRRADGSLRSLNQGWRSRGPTGTWPTGCRLMKARALSARHQERRIDGQLWSLQTSFYPFSFVARGATRLLEASNINEGTVKYLEETLDLKQVGYRDLIATRPPDENEIKLFRLPDDGRISVFVLLRTGFAQDTDDLISFRLTESVFPSDRNQFVINAGEVPNRLGGAAEV